MDDGFADLFFTVSHHYRTYQWETERHVRELRRLIQQHDHLVPHELDGTGWDAYVREHLRA